MTRRDLADAYLTIDHLVTRDGIPEAQRERWNRDFDRTTLAFFGGDFARVLRDMHDLTARIAGDSAPASPTRQLLRLRLEVSPRVLTPADSGVVVRATVLYADTSLRAAQRVQLQVARAGETARSVEALAIPADAAAGMTVERFVPRRTLGAADGTVSVVASLPGARVTRETRTALLPATADSLRAELQRALAAQASGADAQAVASVRARLTLLTDRPDPANSAQFLADLGALVPVLRSDVAAVRAGRNPFAGRTGDTWRVVRGARSEIPMRVFVPVRADTAAMPIVIALHGAGADENMFFEGYGHGVLTRLADSLGFIAVSPATVALAGDPGAVDSLLATLAREQRVDRNRIYVIGHSLGGAVTLQLAAARRDIRAAAVLAPAGTVPPGASLPPTQIIAASADLVISVTRIQAMYDTLRARSLPVSLEIAGQWGHTLIVGAQLPATVHWLLER